MAVTVTPEMFYILLIPYTRRKDVYHFLGMSCFHISDWDLNHNHRFPLNAFHHLYYQIKPLLESIISILSFLQILYSTMYRIQDVHIHTLWIIKQYNTSPKYKPPATTDIDHHQGFL